MRETERERVSRDEERRRENGTSKQTPTMAYNVHQITDHDPKATTTLYQIKLSDRKFHFLFQRTISKTLHRFSIQVFGIHGS